MPATRVRLYAAGGAGYGAVALTPWGYSVLAIGNQIGDGPLGRWVESELRKRGIDLVPGFVEPGSSTPANGILLSPDGRRTIVGSEYADVTWQPVPSWSDVSVCVVDAYSGSAGTAVARSGRLHASHIFGSDLVGEAGRAWTWLVWSAAVHSDPAAAWAMAKAGTVVIVTSGSDPVNIYRGAEKRSVSLEPRTTRDSTGAGDVFTAGLAACAHESIDVFAAVQMAADVAGRYVEWDRDLGVPPLATMGP